jgi:parallel beta-helix repeat protein
MGSAIELNGCSDTTIIENQIVNNSYGIILQNSHENIIQQNHIINNYFFGIDIQYSQDNIIMLNDIINNFHGGIWIRDSSNIAIDDNQISNDFHTSIVLRSSYLISIKNNVFSDVGGVVMSDSRSIILTGNSFHSEGIRISGDLKEHWNTHTIEENDINGLPIVYYSNTQNISVPEETNQVILANATNIKIQGLQTNNISQPIQMGFSSENFIENNSFTQCDNCGIYLHFSDNNIISKNNLTGAESVAVQTYFSMENIIQDNTFSNNFMGIYLCFSEKNTIEKNNFQSNMIPAEFACRGLRINSYHLNKWNQNYWDDWIGFGPKIIIPIILIPFV